MNGGAADVERAELIKWWDALDALPSNDEVESGLQMARECRHPDAQWLASLFPADGVVTSERMCTVLNQHLGDSRAALLFWKLSERHDPTLLTRVAEAGYAPAQAELSIRSTREDAVKLAWAEKPRLQEIGTDCFGWANA
jgi:hypothetical protein